MRTLGSLPSEGKNTSVWSELVTYDQGNSRSSIRTASSLALWVLLNACDCNHVCYKALIRSKQKWGCKSWHENCELIKLLSLYIIQHLVFCDSKGKLANAPFSIQLQKSFLLADLKCISWVSTMYQIQFLRVKTMNKITFFHSEHRIT